MSETTLEQAIECLERSGNYQLIKRYEKPLYYHSDDGSPKLKGIFLDVETTGLSTPEDKIIELGFVVFEYSEDGRVFRIQSSVNTKIRVNPSHLKSLS